MEENQLVEKTAYGNLEAFDMLYEKYMNDAVRTAYLIAGNLPDSEDIVQESFVKAYLHISDLKNTSGFRAWLLKIVTRTAWDYCNKKSREISDDEVINKWEKCTDNQDVSDSLEKMIQSEQTDTIYQAIRKLSIKHRTVIVLYYYNQLSTKEIARICNCLEGTVKSRLFIARKQLKNSLKEWYKQEEHGYEQIRTGHYQNAVRNQ